MKKTLALMLVLALSLLTACGGQTELPDGEDTQTGGTQEQ